MKKHTKHTNHERAGDTSRTSSQGRKLSSGADTEKRGDQQRHPDNKSVIAELKIRSERPLKRK